MTSWPTSTDPTPATAPPRPSTAGSNTSAAPPSGSATSPTTSPDPCSRPAASDPDYTLDREEPVCSGETGAPCPTFRDEQAYEAKDSQMNQVGNQGPRRITRGDVEAVFHARPQRRCGVLQRRPLSPRGPAAGPARQPCRR